MFAERQVNVGVPLNWLASAWAVGNFSAVLMSLAVPLTLSPFSLLWQFRGRSTPLVIEGLVMEAGVIASPTVVLGILDLSDFAVYRGIASALFPLRMILIPSRGSVRALTESDLKLRVRWMLIVGCAGGIGLLCALPLWLLGSLATLDGTMIQVLSDWVLAVFALAVLQTLVYFGNVLSRWRLGGKELFVRRGFDSASTILLTVVLSL
ncbi:MAG: hypothetical protein ACK8QZ_09875, partial [Anaerolineales bacterium]